MTPTKQPETTNPSDCWQAVLACTRPFSFFGKPEPQSWHLEPHAQPTRRRRRRPRPSSTSEKLPAPTAFFYFGKPTATCAIDTKTSQAPAASRAITKDPEAGERQGGPKKSGAKAVVTSVVKTTAKIAVKPAPPAPARSPRSGEKEGARGFLLRQVGGPKAGPRGHTRDQHKLTPHAGLEVGATASQAELF